ncbi:MAG: CvpA family protein [Rhodospirillales bacterium]|nr:CvpA family protein [Rhodospirillales bacterium]MCB9996282.1 CvpA family protein [Rhodospirillales bacterium]
MIFDVIVLAVLLISAGIAFFRGFIREVLTILGVVGGLVAAYFGGPSLSPVVREWFSGDAAADDPQKLLGVLPYDVAADALAYGLIFIIVVIVLSVASHLLSGWAKAIGLGAVDRTFGVVFGIVRGVIILALLYLPVHVLVDQDLRDNWFKDSRTHFYVAGTADWMMKFLPDSIKDDAAQKAEEAAESMAKTTREKLQELDVLRDGAQDKQETAPEQESAPGYEGEQRENMNELFEDNYNE